MGIERAVDISMLPTLSKSGIVHFKDETRRVNIYDQKGLRTSKDAALLLDGLTAAWGWRTAEEVS